MIIAFVGIFVTSICVLYHHYKYKWILPDQQISRKVIANSPTYSPCSDSSTPKAQALNPTTSIPTFSLDESELDNTIHAEKENDGETNHSGDQIDHDDVDDDNDDDDDSNDNNDNDQSHLPPAQFPALNSSQRASSNQSSKNNLMLPPPLPPVRNNLRIPTTGPLPNRLPIANVNASSLRPLIPATDQQNTKKSRKVQLAPGNSPMDWSALTKSGINLAGVEKPLLLKPSMLKLRNGRKGKPLWSSYAGKVYNLTPYLPYHPGGEVELRKAAGRDGTKLFHDVHPWVNWDNMLNTCMVGIMVSEYDPKVDTVALMESMD